MTPPVPRQAFVGREARARGPARGARRERHRRARDAADRGRVGHGQERARRAVHRRARSARRRRAARPLLRARVGAVQGRRRRDRLAQPVHGAPARQGRGGAAAVPRRPARRGVPGAARREGDRRAAARAARARSAGAAPPRVRRAARAARPARRAPSAGRADRRPALGRRGQPRAARCGAAAARRAVRAARQHRVAARRDEPPIQFGGDLRRMVLGPLDERETMRLAHAPVVRACARRPREADDRDDRARVRGPSDVRRRARAPHGAARRRRHAGDEVRLDDVLAERIDALAAAERQLLELVAIAGQPLPIEVAGRALGVTPRSAAAARRLSAVGEPVARDRPRAPRFGRAVPRSHAPRRRPRARRSASPSLHRRLAIALEATDAETQPMLVGEHWEQAGEPARAAALYARAGDRATEAFAFERAVKLYERCLALAPEMSAVAAHQARRRVRERRPRPRGGRRLPARSRARRRSPPMRSSSSRRPRTSCCAAATSTTAWSCSSGCSRRSTSICRRRRGARSHRCCGVGRACACAARRSSRAIRASCRARSSRGSTSCGRRRAACR